MEARMFGWLSDAIRSFKFLATIGNKLSEWKMVPFKTIKQWSKIFQRTIILLKFLLIFTQTCCVLRFIYLFYI